MNRGKDASPATGLINIHLLPQQAHTQTTDLWWDDGKVLEEKRGDLSEICDLHSCWNPQVNEKDLHHSVSVHVGDLKTRATTPEWVLKKYDLKPSGQLYNIPVLSLA